MVLYQVIPLEWVRAHDCHEFHMTKIAKAQCPARDRKTEGTNAGRAGVQRFAVWSNQIK